MVKETRKRWPRKESSLHTPRPSLAAPLAGTLGVSWPWQVGMSPDKAPFWGLPSVMTRHCETAGQGSSPASCRACRPFTEAHWRGSWAKPRTRTLRKPRGWSSECSYLVPRIPDEPQEGSFRWMVSDPWSPKKAELWDQGPGLITQELLWSRVLLKWERDRGIFWHRLRRGGEHPLICFCFFFFNLVLFPLFWEAGLKRYLLFSHVWLLATPCTAARQASPSYISLNFLKPTSIESMMPSNHLILCHPLLLLPSIFPSIRVFPSESALYIRWPKYWSFSFSISPSNEHSGSSSPLGWTRLISLQSKGLSRVFSNTTVQRHQFFGAQPSWRSNSHHPYMTTGKTIALTRRTFIGKVMSLLFNMLSRLVIAFLPRSKCL